MNFNCNIISTILPFKNRLRKTLILSFMIFLINIFIIPKAWVQTVDLPLDHWAYEFIDRLETKGLFDGEDFNMRPFSRLAIAEIILQVKENIDTRPELFSHAEQGLFEQLKGEFYDELSKISPELNIPENEKERHFYTWQQEDLTIHFEGILEEQLKFENKQEVESGVPGSITQVRIQSRVNIKESMAIFVDGRSIILSEIDSLANTAFNPAQGLPVTEKAFVGVTVADNIASYIKFKLPWFDLTLGRDLVEWGPGYRGNFMLSRNSNNYSMFKMSFRYKKAKFEYLHGFLNANKSKYIAAHRLEIKPSKNLRLALQESIVYGGRDVEPLYLNIFAPFIISERHVGNVDNNMIGVDATWFVKKYNLKLYTELFADDFSFTKNIFTAWVNKWAAMAGAYWVNPFGLQDVDLRFEVLRIQPFVYSHRDSTNTYSNYNSIIGHWAGPDSDDWYFELSKRFHKNFKAGITYEARRKGENDITFGTRPVNGKFKFLDGVVERQKYMGVQLKWQAVKDVFFSAKYQYIQSKNLYRIDNNDQNNHRLFVNLLLNY